MTQSASSPSATARKYVRVLIIDDHTLFAESLELALSLEGYDARRADTETGSSSTLLSYVLRSRPRIALLDLDLGRIGPGTRLIRPMVTAGINVIVVTAFQDEVRAGECLRYGARTVLQKTRPLNEILAAVRKINHGLPVIDRAERERLIQVWHDRQEERGRLQQRLLLLTPREQEVLGHLMQGHTVREIATLSVVSEATVRTQVKSILAKLEVSSQLAAVGMANHVGWRPIVSSQRTSLP